MRFVRSWTVSLVVLAAHARGQEYEIVDLGIAGVASSESYSLNERSDIVGVHDNAFTGEQHAFLWTEHAQYGLQAGPTDLGTAGGTFSDGKDINALGQTTGGSYTASSPFSQQAYLWLPAPAYGLPAGMNVLGSLGGAHVASRGYAINDEGQITGQSFSGNPGDTMAFIWLPVADLGLGAGMHALGTLGGGIGSYGVAINRHGEVTGRASSVSGPMHAFLWLPSAKYGLPAGMTDLTPGPVLHSEGSSINDHGEVSGTYIDAAFAIRSFLWLPSAKYGLSAGFNDIGLLAPHPDVHARAINAHGAVVGVAVTAQGFEIAAKWEAGAWADLNSLVQGGSGWTLDVANAISEAGDIVGRGTISGATRAFLLRRTSTPSPVTYCTAKTTSNGCTPVIDSHGVSSVANGSSFQVTCINLRNQKPTLFLYGSNGRANVPFQGGVLCVAAPQKRAPLATSGGTAAPANDCSGVHQLDLNAFALGLLGGNPAAALSVPGTTIDVQTWGRDPGFAPPNGTQLSDALEYVVGL